jgi:acyl-CoA reductase-like NAD-dependent aldehyde dehydrogenase
MLAIANPANGHVIAELPTDDASSVAAKVGRARAAQPAWAATPLPQRVAAIRRFRDGLARELDRLAAVLTSEVGKPIRQARNEITGVLARLDFFLEHTEQSVAARVVHDEAGMRERLTHEPLGVVANISAWNYPYFVGGNVFVPALLTGNAVVYKPSEYAMLTGLEIGRLLHGAGVPQDAFQVVVGGGDAGAALVEQAIDGVFFTGSYATGNRIARAAGPRMIKMQLELGGKDPVYVCGDVDLASAAAATADGAMYNTGQSCCSVERIYVEESLYEPFIDAFVAEVRRFRVGDPTHVDTYIGPLARAPQAAVLMAQVEDAVAKGARLVLGGARIEQPGTWFEPTVVADADHSMTLMREESFGPIVGIQKVAGDEEAVRLMNDTEYGLTAGVFTRDGQRAERVLAQVRAGTAYWNCCDRVSPRLPWSGLGHSGIGLTLSTYGIETFTRPKAWHLRAP